MSESYFGPVLPPDYSPDGDPEDYEPREPEWPEIDPDAEIERVDADGDALAYYAQAFEPEPVSCDPEWPETWPEAMEEGV